MNVLQRYGNHVAPNRDGANDTKSSRLTANFIKGLKPRQDAMFEITDPAARD